MDEDSVWAVGAFGSCRVNTPLSVVTKHGLIAYKFDSAIGYLHNPLEIQQAIRLLRSEIKAPPELYDLINITSPKELKGDDRFYRLFTNIDVIVCEVSSVRIIEYKGWYLQLNRFREMLAEFKIAERDTGALFRSPAAKADIANRIKGLPNSAMPVDVVLNANFYELDHDGLKEEVARLRAMMPDHPVVFVGITTHDFDGSPVRQRIELRDALKAVAETTPDCAVIDPTDYVLRDGVRVAMQDLGHYNKAYELIAAGEIFRQLDAFCQANARVNALAKRRQIRAAARNAAAAKAS